MSRVVAIGSLVAALVVVLLLLTNGFSGTYRVNAVFDQVNGLVKGADVKAAGVDVGTVEQISLGSDRLPHVAMDVDDDYRMHQGGTAEIRATSASGEVNRYVELAAGGGAPLADGAILGTGRTDQPVEIGDVLSTFDPKTRVAMRATPDGLERGTAGRGAGPPQTPPYRGTPPTHPPAPIRP